LTGLITDRQITLRSSVTLIGGGPHLLKCIPCPAVRLHCQPTILKSIPPISSSFEIIRNFGAHLKK
jgi:hypothetical protein